MTFTVRVRVASGGGDCPADFPVRCEEGGGSYFCVAAGESCGGNYRDCSMYPEECGADGICMSAMDSPGICGFTCNADADCEAGWWDLRPEPRVSALTPMAIGLARFTSVVLSMAAHLNVTQATAVALHVTAKVAGAMVEVQCAATEVYCEDAAGNGYCHEGSACPDTYRTSRLYG